MGKKWDYDVPSIEVWAECLRVLKPGGHLLAFAGTRTQHRMAVRIEDAGFEIRDMIAWVYGSGFPKSLDVSKTIDKAAGAEREVVGQNRFAALNGKANVNTYGTASRPYETAPATPEAQQWEGWGTALKPALEPITVARKPLIGTVAANVLAHGTGGLNIDGCRVACDDVLVAPKSDPANRAGVVGLAMQATGSAERNQAAQAASIARTMEMGRWPANLIHDGSDKVVGLFPGADADSAARFFYCAKASKTDRGDGNAHPTVKPTDLMRYLCRLVTPLGGIVLDPFMGSGSTGKAALLEGFHFIGIERQEEYFNIAKKRLSDMQIGLSL
tara:strand:+ start:592 stop:1578 length:987 start_codon:yes stop_codon:yes gene_type:complete